MILGVPVLKHFRVLSLDKLDYTCWSQALMFTILEAQTGWLFVDNFKIGFMWRIIRICIVTHH